MRVTLDSLLILGAVLVSACLAIVGALWLSRRKRDMQAMEPHSPLLVMPVSSRADLRPLQAQDEVRPRRARGGAIRQMALNESAGLVDHVPHSTTYAADSATSVADPLTATTGRFTSGSVAPEVVHGHSLRFHRPAEGTLEFLPGLLEVIGGPDAGHELRFVRPQDGSAGVITFGRREGPPYLHVQLLEPTVSRSHARLKQEGERWRLINLSRTNPVLLNRRPLDGVEASQMLKDADVIEMGALVFRFHGR